MTNWWVAEAEIDERITKAAKDAGLDPAVLDWHLEAVHGWETHDIGWEEKGLAGAVRCLLNGGCNDATKSS